MARKTENNWYGVRTLVRLIAIGQAKLRDRAFDPDSTMVEDRVVLFLAQTPDDAIRQAKAEVRQYCRTIRFENVYGQRVRLKYLRVVEAFCLLDNQPISGWEVFSSTAIVSNSISDSEVIRQRFGEQPKRLARARWKFLDAQILQDASNLMSARKRGRVKPS